MPETPTRSLKPSSNPQARMQQLLREQAAPTDEAVPTTVPVLQDTVTPKSGDPASLQQDDKKPDQKYDSMTSHTANNQTKKREGKSDRNKSSIQTMQQESQSENLSVADMIRTRAEQRGIQEVLKTVTLKLSPSLDERIERYCFENKMKKQEFWAEAAALYFETVGETE